MLRDRKREDSEIGRNVGSKRDRSICFNRHISHTSLYLEVVAVPSNGTYASIKSKDPRIEYERIHCADNVTSTLMFATTRRDDDSHRCCRRRLVSSSCLADWLSCLGCFGCFGFAFGAGARVGIVREFLSASATVVGRTLAHLAVFDTRLLVCSHLCPASPLWCLWCFVLV